MPWSWRDLFDPYHPAREALAEAKASVPPPAPPPTATLRDMMASNTRSIVRLAGSLLIAEVNRDCPDWPIRSRHSLVQHRMRQSGLPLHCEIVTAPDGTQRLTVVVEAVG